MKKRLFALALMLCVALCLLPVMAMAEEIVATGTCGENLTWTVSEYGVLTISGEGQMEDYSLDPETGKSTAPWYDEDLNFSWVKTEESVTGIGAYAFAGDTNLSEASLSRVKHIGEYAFSGCVKLNDVSISIWDVEHIGDYAFYGCEKLTHAVLSDALTYVGDYAYAGCKALTYAEIHAPNATWGEKVFADSGLADVDILLGVEKLGSGMFYGCTALESLYIPNSVTAFGDSGDCFAGCENLTIYAHGGSPAAELAQAKGIAFQEIDHVPFEEIATSDPFYDTTCTYCGIPCGYSRNVTWALENDGTLRMFGQGDINYYESGWENHKAKIQGLVVEEGVTGRIAGFTLYEDLKSVMLPSTITDIEKDTFAGCFALEHVVLSENLKSIGSNAFADCYSLTEIRIPASVTSFGAQPFANCTNLTGIWVDAESKSFANDQYGVLYSKDMTILYEAPGMLEGDYVIPKSVTQFHNASFIGCNKLRSVEIPEGVEWIETNLFAGCTSLEKVSMPNSVTWIWNFAFEDCTSLKEITIPRNVNGISSCAFQNCTSLEKITFLGDAPEISSCFSGVTATAYYPAGNETWTEKVMQDYGGDITWVSSDKIVDIASGTCGDNISWVLTFDGTLIVSGEGDVPDLHNEGYPWKEYAERIKKVIFEEGVTNVPDSAFNYYYPNLESVELKSVEIIDYTAFTQCYQLKSVSLPDTLKEIRGGAFSCTALSSVDFPESLISIGGSAFSDTDLTSVVLHEGLETIGVNAFCGCDSLKSVVLPDSVTDMDMGVFMGCTSLETVNIPKGVTILHMSLFSGCTSLKSIVIPEGVEMLDMCVFSYSGLTSVTFSGSVKEIYNPFEDCQFLKEVIFEGDAPAFVYYSFRGLTLTAYYPANNATWTEDVLQDYSGDVTWVALEPDVEFVGASLSLKGDIGLNFYAEVSQKLLADTGAYMKFTGSGAARYMAMTDGILDESDGSYRYSVALNAKNMGDNVTAQVYNATGAVGDSSTLSIKYYADYVINNSEKEVFVNLMKAMLNYGAAAQVEFGYDVENLVNADMSEADRTMPETLDVAKYAHTWSGEEDGIEVTNASLLLQSETKIRIYFKLAEGKTLEEFTFTIDGVEVTPTQSGDEYYIEKTNVAAKDLDTMYTFCLGERQLTYCGLSYVNQVLSYSSDADLLNLVKALYVYNQATNAYFGA